MLTCCTPHQQGTAGSSVQGSAAIQKQGVQGHYWCCVRKAKCTARHSCWLGKASPVPTVVRLGRLAANMRQQCWGSMVPELLAQLSGYSLTE